MLEFVIDTAALDDTGPYFSAPEPTNEFTVPETRFPAAVGLYEPGREPQAGIGYIDPSVGGSAALLADHWTARTNGPVGRGPARFDGSHLGTVLVMGMRIQGPVGRSTFSQTGQRATSALTTTVPPDDAQIAAFYGVPQAGDSQ